MGQWADSYGSFPLRIDLALPVVDGERYLGVRWVRLMDISLSFIRQNSEGNEIVQIDVREHGWIIWKIDECKRFVVSHVMGLVAYFSC